MSLQKRAAKAWELHKRQRTAENVARTRHLLREILEVDEKATQLVDKYVDYNGFQTLQVVKVQDFESCCFFSSDDGLHGIYTEAVREDDLNPISEPIHEAWQLGKFASYLHSRHAHLHEFIERRAIS